jgi:hypothetical protein
VAIGVPGEDIGSPQLVNAGEVEVVFGSAAGLDAARAQRLRQGISGMPGQAESGDEFGAVLARGKFNGDAFFDLATGVPGEDIGSISNAGAVNVIYGASLALLGSAGPGAQIFNQGTGGVLALPRGRIVSDRR